MNDAPAIWRMAVDVARIDGRQQSPQRLPQRVALGAEVGDCAIRANPLECSFNSFCRPHVALLLKAITAAFPSVSAAWIVAISLPIVVVIEAPPARPVSVLDRAPLAFEDFKQVALRTIDFAALLI